jgi:hypothetical protein
VYNLKPPLYLFLQTCFRKPAMTSNNQYQSINGSNNNASWGGIHIGGSVKGLVIGGNQINYGPGSNQPRSSQRPEISLRESDEKRSSNMHTVLLIVAKYFENDEILKAFENNSYL